MPPTSDGKCTVGCALRKLVPDAAHHEALTRGVRAVHESTVLATELLNLHLRRSHDIIAADGEDQQREYG